MYKKEKPKEFFELIMHCHTLPKTIINSLEVKNTQRSLIKRFCFWQKNLQ